MATSPPHRVLMGRRSESEALAGLLGTVRAGESQALVLRGEAGVGKTALLEHAIESGSDLRVVRAVGVESEMELAFAALHQLCAPMLDRLDRLPDPQRYALRTAFGVDTGDAPDRFFVALAVLSLLSEVAEEQPLLCVVDHAQWLDQESAQALGFVARRLGAESVALVFATRERSEDFRGLPELLFHRQSALEDDDLRRYADELELDVALFDSDRTGAAVLGRVGRDVESGMASGEVRGTPTLFIDGQVHRGAHDAAALLEALAR